MTIGLGDYIVLAGFEHSRVLHRSLLRPGGYKTKMPPLRYGGEGAQTVMGAPVSLAIRSGLLLEFLGLLLDLLDELFGGLDVLHHLLLLGFLDFVAVLLELAG